MFRGASRAVVQTAPTTCSGESETVAYAKNIKAGIRLAAMMEYTVSPPIPESNNTDKVNHKPHYMKLIELSKNSKQINITKDSIRMISENCCN